MIVFSVAIPVDLPAWVFDLVRGYFLYLRGVIGQQEVDGVVFSETKEGRNEDKAG